MLGLSGFGGILLSIIVTAPYLLWPTPDVLERPSTWYFNYIHRLVGLNPIFAAYMLMQSYIFLDVDKIKTWRIFAKTFLVNASTGVLVITVSYLIWVVHLQYTWPVPFLGRVTVLANLKDA